MSHATHAIPLKAKLFRPVLIEIEAIATVLRLCPYCHGANFKSRVAQVGLAMTKLDTESLTDQ